MKNTDAITALAVLAEGNRLDVFRLRAQAGPEGMPAGEVADVLDLVRTTSRSISTAYGKRALSPCGARPLDDLRSGFRSHGYDLIGFLTDNCCRGRPTARCAPASGKPIRKYRIKETV